MRLVDLTHTSLILPLAGALCVVACAPVSGGVRRSGAPQGEPQGEPECVMVDLDDGQTVCLSSEPLTGQLGASREGLAQEALVEPSSLETLPPQVDLRDRLRGCLEVRSQGECGWCAGHASAAALVALACAEGCGPARVSMPHLWSTGRGGPIGDCGPGMYLPVALRAATATPLVRESDWAYGAGRRAMESTRPSGETLAERGRLRAESAVIIRDGLPGTGMTATELDQVRRALASGRVVAVSGALCLSQGWGSGTTVIDAPTGACAMRADAYHAWVLVGYDDTTGQYIGLNSWGTGWGQGGYFRMTRAYVETQIYGAGYLTSLDRTSAQCPEAPTTRACGDITDCATCTEATGCAFCDGRCVDANATRTGRQDGAACGRFVTNAPFCPPPVGACLAHTNCGTCAADPACAWCANISACLAWPAQAAACNGMRVATEADQCNGATGRCEQQTDCATCQAMPGCGWCGSASPTFHATTVRPCVGGDATASDRASCNAWSGPGAMCPAPPGADAGVSDAGPAVTADAGSTADAQAPTASMCSAVGTACSTDTCCGSLVCRGGACCSLVSSPCASAADCCDGVACVGGTCQCIPRGSPCSSTELCCGSDVCRAGTCQRP
ncbi:MAG: hypothetical protein K1X94_35040 [Sandaracinaceae bacterium]|nr:hypothetical protein [Sandaracinaceae bacterium]